MLAVSSNVAGVLSIPGENVILLAGNYNLWLVVMSLLIAVLASYTALDMAGRVAVARGRSAFWWLLGGSAAMGIGIWSMHFLGMLAYRLPIPMDYDPLITFLSLLIAIASSGFALWMVCRQALSRRGLVFGSLLMGGGVCGMHYTGMAAMRMHPPVHYIPSMFLLSVIIAVTASGAALWIAFHLRERSPNIRWLRAGAAAIMGIAIAGMHYTGMAAAQFPKGSVCQMTVSAGGMSTGRLAPVIIVFTLGVLSVALITSMFDLRMEEKTAVLSESLDRAQQELQFLALHDSLTKLPNRMLLEDRLGQELANMERNRRRFSVLFLDLDGFKRVNDAFGHHIGDLLLVEVAARIRKLMRSRDTVARLGGDEFVLLADAAEPSDAANLADRLIAAIQRPFDVGGHVCEVSVSIGIVLCGTDAVSPHELLKNADAAMYHAKGMGRNTFCFYDASMKDDSQKQLDAMHNLRMAVDRRELVLYYQPKFDTKSGAMLGAEALIRWNHPTRGILPPSEFIPLAERIGLILRIGEWTLQEACRQLSEWHAAGYPDLTVAVNVSAVQFNHAGLVDLVEQTLTRHSLNASSLILEITESTAMRDPDVSMGVLRRLQKLGVRISIDDFGTGYSSLLYLRKLPAGELKIDRGFVQELEQDTDDAAIISAIIGLGHSLNLDIVAEGVETPAQHALLTKLGCNSLQGFLFGRPMPPSDLIASIRPIEPARKSHAIEPVYAGAPLGQLVAEAGA